MVLSVGCQRSSSEQQTQAVEGSPHAQVARVLLEGAFAPVTKGASGYAKIVGEGEKYSLELEQVAIEADVWTRVYLVGLPEAMSSAAVDGAEMKYDMGALEKPNQRIELPSRPDPALRSVVLWNPKYKANLAAASLTPTDSTE